MAITSLPKSETDIRTLILNKLGDSSTITAAEHRAVEDALADAIFYTPLGDIKEVACSLSYINDNFDMNPTPPLLPGRGKVGSERYGWAICNGSNGTIDKRGRVGIGYDSTRTLFDSGSVNGIGAVGGAERHTLTVTQMPQHNHQVILHKGDDLNFSANYTYNGPVGLNGVNATITGPFIVGTDNSQDSFKRNVTANSPGDVLYSGGDLPHNNMQPYIVTLFIQKIVTPYA
jgi:microcystin-dependent protein